MGLKKKKKTDLQAHWPLPGQIQIETDCDSLQFQMENVDDRPQIHNISGN